MRFNHLANLHWLWVVLGLAIVIAFAVEGERRRLRRFASANLIPAIAPRRSLARRLAKSILALAALVALVAAMLDPRWGVSFEDVQQRGIDVIVVVDVSRSMLAEDASPSRLERARQAAIDLADAMAGDRVGLVAAAGTAALRCPLTVDYGAFRMSLRELTPESSTRGGSLLGDAIRLAADSFTDTIPDSKAIIVLTDGEDHGSYPVEAAAEAFEERGIRVYTVGIGDPVEGARIPVEVGGRRVFLTYDGEEVWSRMDGEALRRVALAGGGAFVPAGRRRLDMASVFEEWIAPLTTREFESTRVRLHHAQYQWFAALALGLLVIDGLVGTARRAPGDGGRTT